MWKAITMMMVMSQLGCAGSRAQDAETDGDVADRTGLDALPPASADRPDATPERTPPPVGDAEILGSINARDANLIETSTLATEKASGGDVKTLAAEVLKSHQESLTRGGELAKALELSRELPPDSAMARQQREAMDQLSLQSGAAFDRTYVQYVHDFHEAELRKITGSQAPAAQHPQVKAFVTNRIPSLQAHLATAAAWLAANPQ